MGAKSKKKKWKEMTKKQRKAAVKAEAKRIEKEIPYMWRDLAKQIAKYNLKNPKHKITDNFLIKLFKKAEEMEESDVRSFYFQHDIPEVGRRIQLRRVMGADLYEKVLESDIEFRYFVYWYDWIATQRVYNLY